MSLCIIWRPLATTTHVTAKPSVYNVMIGVNETESLHNAEYLALRTSRLHSVHSLADLPVLFFRF